MLLGCGLMFWTDKVARKLDTAKTKLGLWLLFALTLVLIAMRFMEFPHTHFRWNDNAYASIVWTILAMHLTYLLAAAGEFFIMAAHLYRQPIDVHHAHDVNLGGIYWYWIVSTWIITYALVYFGARLL